MLFMNTYDQENALQAARASGNPRQLQAATALIQLVAWVDTNSDGWAYWPAPVTAARRLMEGLQRMEARSHSTWGTHHPENDFTAAELDDMTAPIRTFLQRHQVAWRSVMPALEDQPSLFAA